MLFHQAWHEICNHRNHETSNVIKPSGCWTGPDVRWLRLNESLFRRHHAGRGVVGQTSGGQTGTRPEGRPRRSGGLYRERPDSNRKQFARRKITQTPPVMDTNNLIQSAMPSAVVILVMAVAVVSTLLARLPGSKEPS